LRGTGRRRLQTRGSRGVPPQGSPRGSKSLDGGQDTKRAAPNLSRRKRGNRSVLGCLDAPDAYACRHEGERQQREARLTDSEAEVCEQGERGTESKDTQCTSAVCGPTRGHARAAATLWATYKPSARRAASPGPLVDSNSVVTRRMRSVAAQLPARRPPPRASTVEGVPAERDRIEAVWAVALASPDEGDA
jgi:hypothetical protein